MKPGKLYFHLEQNKIETFNHCFVLYLLDIEIQHNVTRNVRILPMCMKNLSIGCQFTCKM